MNAVFLRIVQAALLLVALLSLGVSMVGFYSYFSYKPPSRANLVAVAGEVEKYEKKTSASGSDYLDIYLKGNPIRFRVGVGGYDNYFKSEPFNASVKPGSNLVIEADKKALENPNVPPNDPQKTVFVEALRDDANVYIDWDERVKWQGGDRIWAFIIGAIFLGGAISLTLLNFFFLPKLATKNGG